MCRLFFSFFFFNDTATTEIYTLSLHDALPIWSCARRPVPDWSTARRRSGRPPATSRRRSASSASAASRSEEHTSELQSPCNLVCRLLLEKKKLFMPTANHLRIPWVPTRLLHTR